MVHLAVDKPVNLHQSKPSESISQDTPSLIGRLCFAKSLVKLSHCQLRIQRMPEASSQNHAARLIELGVTEILNANPSDGAKDQNDCSREVINRYALENRKYRTHAR